MTATHSRPDGSDFLSVAMDAARMGAFYLDVENNRLTYSKELHALVGKTHFTGTIESVEAVTHPDDIQHLRQALDTSDQLDHDFRTVRPDGEIRWMHWRGRIVRRRDGTPVEVYGVKLDITERKRAEERQPQLLAELNHRLRNTFAQMGMIIELSRASAASVDALANAITDRLDALARAHARCQRSPLTGIPLRELVEDELAPYRNGTNTSVEGPDLPLMPQSAQPLAMVLHELITNAVKYGALSTANGCVAVRWKLAGAQLNLVWQETDGPTVVMPKGHGFGTRLIDNIVRHELGGRAELSLPPTGARCEIEIPVARVTGAASARMVEPSVDGHMKDRQR